MDYIYSFFKGLFSIDCTLENNVPEGPHKIVAFGNVLVDYTAKLEDSTILERFQLSPNSKGELSMETLNEITAAVSANKSLDEKFRPGGCALNTVRILKHLKSDATFFGAIGNDEPGNYLSQYLRKQGLDVRLQSVINSPTGSAICLVYKDNTCLYANIGASKDFSTDYLKLEEQNNNKFLRPIIRRQILYIESFFIPHRVAVCDYIMENYITGRRKLALNLSGSYVVNEQFEMVLKMAKKAYFLFGNEDEFKVLAQKLNCEEINDIVDKIFEEKQNKIVIITKGSEGVELISNFIDEHAEPGQINFETFKAPHVEKIVDTTGAGDAFVAGFLDAWLERRPLTECIRIAMDIAAQVITVVGCYLPDMIEK